MNKYAFLDDVTLYAGDTIRARNALSTIEVDFDATEAIRIKDGQLTRNLGTIYVTETSVAADCVFTIERSPTLLAPEGKQTP